MHAHTYTHMHVCTPPACTNVRPYLPKMHQRVCPHARMRNAGDALPHALTLRRGVPLIQECSLSLYLAPAPACTPSAPPLRRLHRPASLTSRLVSLMSRVASCLAPCTRLAAVAPIVSHLAPRVSPQGPSRVLASRPARHGPNSPASPACGLPRTINEGAKRPRKNALTMSCLKNDLRPVGAKAKKGGRCDEG